MLITPHLTVEEFTATRHAWALPEQLELWGSPFVQAAAQRFASSVFERVHDLIGRMHVTSGLRCAHLNAEVGGRPTSRHVLGLAIDVIPMDMSIPAAMDTIERALDAGALQDLDEAIHEMGWIHLQGAPLGSPPRRLTLVTTDGIKFRPYERKTA